MADVLRQAHKTNSTVRNGGIVTFVQETGEYETHVSAPGGSGILSLNIPSGTMETRYDGRFDDPRYYTGDTSS